MAHPSKPNETQAGDATLVRRSSAPGNSSRPRPQPLGRPVMPNAFPASSASAGEPPTPLLSPELERSAISAIVDSTSATYEDLAPPPLPWQGAVPGNRAGHPIPGAQPPAQQLPSHVPWQVAESWGPTTLSIEANTAAGASYLLLFITGLLVYFNERNNRYVRFHAMQSILLTGVITVFSVVASILSALCYDIAARAHLFVFATLGSGIAVIAVVAVLCAWLGMIIAAWTGHDLHLPFVGAYAERYAAPPVQPPAPPFY
ncbi:MAG: hypothetical protein ACXWQR_04890 [Ktedonobacterales bacterium]